MPVFNQYSGAWTLAADNASPANVIFADKVSHNYDIRMAPVGVIAGSGQTLVRKFDNIEANISISGPALFGTADLPPSPTAADLLGGVSSGISGGSYCYDVYHYVKDKIAGGVDPVSIFSRLSSMSMKFGDQGASYDASWWFDPITDGIKSQIGSLAPKIPWIVSGAGLRVPLRIGNWYDYFLGTSWLDARVVKQFDVNIKVDYETFNNLGGSRVFVNKKYGENAITGTDIPWWNHIPSRVLKNILVSFTFTGIINRATPSPYFGRAAENVTFPAQLSRQPCDQLDYNPETNLDVYALNQGPGELGAVSNFLASLKGNTTQSPVETIGTYIKSIKNNIVPGLMTYTIEGEYIVPIFGV